jgi:DNA-binding HxlR family transcriptional regulator
MKRTSFADLPCPVARSLDLIGEWWSPLILREAFMGVRRFGDFERRLGIAKNILSARLRTLVEGGILERRPSRDDAREVEYRLTAKGRDLFPVLLAMAQWGARWTDGGDGLRFVNRHTGAPIADMVVRDVDGTELTVSDLAPASDPASG